MSRTEADHEAARELMLYADNTGELYPQKQAILKNLAKKMQKDQYIPEKATKLWMYWMDEAARRYTKEFGTGSGYGVFNAATRRLAAGWEERAMRDRVPEYGNVLDKYREKNPGRRSIHTAKWDRCVKEVKSKGGSYDPYAVCSAQLGERGSVKAGHRRKNPLPTDREIDSDVTLSALDYALSLMSYFREPRERERYDQTVGKHVIAAFRAWKTRSFNRLAHAALKEAQTVIKSSPQWIAGSNQHVLAEKAIQKGLSALSFHRKENPSPPCARSPARRPFVSIKK